MSLLEVRGLAKAFGGVRAVDGVDFALSRGEILALIGPNGAGKSTCFNLLTGQLAPDAGLIRLDGHAITGLEPRRIWELGVGRTFQIAQAFASFTVAQNIELAMLANAGRALRPFGRAGRLYRTEALALLARVGLLELSERVCATLAYGDLKRVELALALTNRPRLLLMDEPTAGMAPEERAALMRLVVDLARREDVGVLFTEHDMDVVFAHAGRIMVMDRGRLIAEGPPAMVRADPQVRAVYLGSAQE
jgi:branched-chain amino acid transport system ATP-binding protein